MSRNLLKKVLPTWGVQAVRRWRLSRERARNTAKSVQEVFSDIYRYNKWGGETGSFCSGSGSRGPVADAYCDFVARFVADNGIRSIVDLGCGDFEIGRRIAPHVSNYTGIDVVPELIEALRQTNVSSSISFECVDIVNAPLPDGDLCLVRQVLQHLSNQEIVRILRKLRAFRHVLITEHQLPAALQVPNRDKPHGPDTRLVDLSAVVLDAPPFFLVGVEPVLVVPAEHCLVSSGETIVTYHWSATGVAHPRAG